jgi:hypothetical protein
VRWRRGGAPPRPGAQQSSAPVHASPPKSPSPAELERGTLLGGRGAFPLPGSAGEKARGVVQQETSEVSENFGSLAAGRAQQSSTVGAYCNTPLRGRSRAAPLPDGFCTHLASARAFDAPPIYGTMRASDAAPIRWRHRLIELCVQAHSTILLNPHYVAQPIQPRTPGPCGDGARAPAQGCTPCLRNLASLLAAKVKLGGR